jgi:hypothetical protein
MATVVATDIQTAQASTATRMVAQMAMPAVAVATAVVEEATVEALAVTRCLSSALA